MATDLELLLVRVEANIKQYEKELARARQIGVKELRAVEAEGTKAAKRLEQAFGGVGSRVSKGLKNFGAGVIAGLGVEQIARAAATAIKSIADIGESAKKLGLSNAEFQTLSLAAQLSGIEVAALASGMKKLALNSSDASRGQGEFGAILKANGVSITDANGQLLSQTEILARVADLVRNAASEQDKMTIAFAALGKAGPEAMNLLEQGADGVRRAMAEAKAAGVDWTDEQIAQAQRFDDKLDVLIKKISFGLKSAFLQTAPYVESFVDNTIKELYLIESAANRIGAALTGAFDAATKQGVDPAKIPRLDLGGGASVPNPYYRRPEVTKTGNVKLYNPGARSAGFQSGSDPNSANNIAKRQDPVTVLPDTAAIRAAESAAKRAADEAKRRREQIQGVITDLKFEGDQLKRNDLQREISLALQRAEVAVNSEKGRQIAALVTANFNLEKSQKAQAENAKLNADAEAELIQIRIDAAQVANEKAMELQQSQRDGFIELAQLGYSAMERIAMGGEKAKDVILDLAKSLAQAALQAALFGQGPLASFLGGSSGGGIFGSLASGLFGGGVPASIYHDGGIVGRGGPMRNVSPALFTGAQRYHSGGIAGLKSGEVPAILQRGEIVIPRGGKMSGGPSQANITVNVTGATGNSEVKRMVHAGVAAGLSQYARGEQERAVERQARG